MPSTAGNRHAERSARTRNRFIEAGQKLFAERSIDSVSLNEITVAAGQKNRNALQYHFGGRDGLLQAIIDSHAARVHELRQRYLEDTDDDSARGAARALVGPLVDYVEENPRAVFYIKILSQMAALNSTVLNPATTTSISFRHDENLERLLRRALAHLKPAETRRRLFLTVSLTFHGIGDICRVGETRHATSALKQRAQMFEQVILAVESLLAAPPLEDG
jgi:AcrR family transcriptional regulator